LLGIAFGILGALGAVITIAEAIPDHRPPQGWASLMVAVLVLAGDIDVAQAKPLVEKYFGAIPAGPKSVRPVAPVPTLAAPKAETIKDRVAAVMVSRYWAIPGGDTPDAASLEVAGSVLGGLASSRLDT
ncbi:insulinase family protein, partial [Streptococcus suis]